MKSYKVISMFFIITTLVFTLSCNRTSAQVENKYVVEIIGSGLDIDKIESIARYNGVSDTRFYKWKNHVVLYSFVEQINSFTEQLKTDFPGLQIKVYDKPFYNFSKADRCADTALAKDWQHILLTANLVEDEEMQHEYLDYHKTQFTEWPEVAEGFCNASFQQLLVYKNGRQLMLVISIPADKTLDELNPKTTENNPRVDDWNLIMGKYQEGIDGTGPDEKWVFLEKIELSDK